MRSKLTFYIILSLSMLSVILSFLLTRTTKVNESNIEGFTPVRDDIFAAKYAPTLEQSKEYGDPTSLYYRASKSVDGKTHITYHFVWEYERNESSGFKPWLSRNIYTGGLSLQRTMFGKGDIEMVSLVITPNGSIEKVTYETAESHSPTDFGVKHKTVETIAQPPFHFRVVSWNHMFDLVSEPSPHAQVLTPQYFTETLWQEYEMAKENEKLLKKSRAHMDYERESIDSQ